MCQNKLSKQGLSIATDTSRYNVGPIYTRKDFKSTSLYLNYADIYKVLIRIEFVKLTSHETKKLLTVVYIVGKIFRLNNST
jgi:hypothetical protein